MEALQYSYTKDTSIYDVAMNVSCTPAVRTRTLKKLKYAYEVNTIEQLVAFMRDKDKMNALRKQWGIGKQSFYLLDDMIDEIEAHLDKPLPTAAENPQSDADYKVLKLELIKLIAPAVVQGSELNGKDVAKFCIDFADTVIENLKDKKKDGQL